MVEPGQREAEAATLEAEMAEVCGVVNAATGRLVGLIARVIRTGSWEGWGIRSAGHWVSWKCGVSAGRAAELVAMANRLGELPATRAALEAGEVSADQAAVVCRHVPAVHDAEAAALARVATVSQLRRSLGRYSYGDEPAAAPQVAEGDDEGRRVSFGTTRTGRWCCRPSCRSMRGRSWSGRSPRPASRCSWPAMVTTPRWRWPPTSPGLTPWWPWPSAPWWPPPLVRAAPPVTATPC